MLKNKKTVIVSVISVLLVIALSVGAVMLYQHFRPEIEEGSKTITITVKNDVTGEDFDPITVKTDEQYLKAVLIDKEIAQGSDGEYGFFIETVNGITADSSKNQFWNIKINGEDSMYGADSLAISDGDRIELVLKIW